MTKEAAKSKIRALLALANRPGTPHEGETALAMAQKLAAKHGLKITRTLRHTAKAAETDWLKEYMANVDRTVAESAAREFQRQQTRIRNVRAMGYQAYLDGIDRAYVPFKRGTTFGVNQRSEWLVGWATARTNHPRPE